MKKVDHSGKRFGKLLVIKRLPSKSYTKAKYLALCDCGNETIVTGSNIECRKSSVLGYFMLFGVRNIVRRSENSGYKERIKLMQLRSYQEQAKDAIFNEWQKGILRTLLVLPTGCG